MEYDITTITRYKNSASYKIKYALTFTERRDLVRACNTGGLVLFEYYLRVAAMDHKDFSDAAAANYFGWSEQTAKRHRLALVKAGWVLFEKARTSNGTRIQLVHLGQKEVSDFIHTRPSRPALSGERSAHKEEETA